MDLGYGRPCEACVGSGKDRKNRKRKCPKCHGVGKTLICTSCEEDMPCSGTKNIHDQSYCLKNDPRFKD